MQSLSAPGRTELTQHIPKVWALGLSLGTAGPFHALGVLQARTWRTHRLQGSLPGRHAHLFLNLQSRLSLPTQSLPLQTGAANAPSGGHDCFSGTLSLLPPGTCLSCPLPSSLYRCCGTTGVSKPHSEGLCFDGESPNFTQFDGNNEFFPGTPHESVVGTGPGRGRSQRLPSCCNQDYPFP